jgi:hypothetical protein
MPNAKKATKRLYRTAVHTVITIPDPEHLKTLHGLIHGSVEWRCETPNYPTFEVVFKNSNPFNKSKSYKVRGTIEKPVVLQPATQGIYEYSVRHFPKRPGDPIITTGPSVASIGIAMHTSPGPPKGPAPGQ